MEIKRRRRLSFGTVLAVMFESRDTMHMQVQEMARVEKLVTDEQIQLELGHVQPVDTRRRHAVRDVVYRVDQR